MAKEEQTKYGEELDRILEEAEKKLGRDEDKLTEQQEERAKAYEKACKDLVPEEKRGELYFLIRDFFRAKNMVGVRMFVRVLNGLTRSQSTPQEILQDMDDIVRFCQKKRESQGIKLDDLEEARELLEISMTKDSVIRQAARILDYPENAVALADVFYASVPAAVVAFHDEVDRAKNKNKRPAM